MSQPNRSAEDAVFDLVTYLVTSARDLLDEPLAYGPFRLIEAASRLIEIAEQVAPEGDEFLVELKRELDRDKVYLVVSDSQPFEEWLDRLSERIATEVVARNERSRPR